MGQQQLLLIVLSVIIVGVAILVAPTMFVSNATQANRDAIISDMINLSTQAQKYYRTPSMLGGGDRSFSGFSLSPYDTANANGCFSLSESVPSGTAYVAGSTATISPSGDTFYIVACGKELGDNQTTPIKSYLAVTPKDVLVTILN